MLHRLLATSFFLCFAIGEAAPLFSQVAEPVAQPTTQFPGERFQGPLPELTPDETELARALKEHVEKLSTDIGERNLQHYEKLIVAAQYLEGALKGYGYEVVRQMFRVRGLDCWNIVVERPGKMLANEIFVVGGHYDSAQGAPGANDNGSGTAAALVLVQRLAQFKPDRTLRFVFFVNEEPPYFQTEDMGSYQYAKLCKDRNEKVVAMLSLETIGFYSDEPNSQNYPAAFRQLYPTTGNFIGIVGNVESKQLVSDVLQSFRKHTRFPAEGGALPAHIRGVGWSDHWSFWQFGYPAVMLTDTAPFRYPHYHLVSDTPDKLDYPRMARVVRGVQRVVEELTVSPPR